MALPGSISNYLEITILIICATLSTAIRVEYGTNNGPILPSLPSTTRRPQPPFRDPAPVWENYNDILNPNPYQYVLPPPSRPKPLTNNYKMSSRYTTTQQPRKEVVIGKIVSPSSIDSIIVSNVANQGFKYNAIVPLNNKKQYSSKFNGKYNTKTKKYKGYENSKYLPTLYYSSLINLPSIMYEQQLPLLPPAQPFQAPSTMHPPSIVYTIKPPKVAYTKDDKKSAAKNLKPHKLNSIFYDSQKTRR